MSVTSAGVAGGAQVGGQSSLTWLRDYFWSDNTRRVQTVLGLIWLLDGGLQFQGFMYSHAFPATFVGAAAGQPNWLHSSMIWAAKIANGDLTVWNTLFALTQVGLGIGLLYRPLVRWTLAASFAWTLVVWWFGEGFGGLFMNAAQPLTGAPGGVLMYTLIGLVAWPNGRPGGLLGLSGAKIMWASLWLVMAWLWLCAPSNAPDATSSMMTATGSGIGVISHLQNDLTSATQGGGVPIALVLAALSAAIGIAVAADWRPRLFLAVAIVLNLVYWIIPQGLGGIFAGGATDPNSGPLFVLLACAMFPLVHRRPDRLAATEGSLA